LLVATPGAGKTTYALTVAARLLALREVAAVTVVTPTEHLKYQWARAAARFGIALDPSYRNAQGRAGADFQGVAVTYAQVAAHPALHRQRTEGRRTLVIFDELHHAGDALSWGDAIREAFEPARRRLALTGTPFRSDTSPIPFVAYEPEPDGTKRSASDYVYGYGPALADGVVRPVIFLAYSGEMHWRTRAGDEIAATLGAPMAAEQLAQAWRTALDPQGEWVARVLEAADRRLTEVRRGMPDAEPEQVALLLRKRQADQVARSTRAATAHAPHQAGGAPASGTGTARKTLAALRKELSGLIAAWHHRTGQPHGVIHAELRRACGGPPVPEATAEQIRARIGMLRRRAVSGR